MRPDRYNDWVNRLIREQLGIWGELWAVPADYPTIERLRAVAEKYGRSTAPDDLAYFAYRSLLLEVVNAAGAVEYAVKKLETAAKEAQDWVTKYMPPSPPGQPQTEFGVWVGAPTVRLAYLELHNAMTAVRTIQERMDRRGPKKDTRVGLLAVLASGPLQDEVRQAYDVFYSRTSEARRLANFGLHGGSLPGGGTASAKLNQQGAIVLRIPNRVEGSLEVFDEFEFTDGREALAYVTDLLVAVDELIDKLLTAIANATPTRVRGGAP